MHAHTSLGYFRGPTTRKYNTRDATCVLLIYYFKNYDRAISVTTKWTHEIFLPRETRLYFYRMEYILYGCKYLQLCVVSVNKS